MDLKAKLNAMGMSLPAAPKPVATYVPAVRTGDLIVVSGQLPMRDGRLICQGSVPSAVSLEQAREAAKQCALNGLAVVDAMIDSDWTKFVRIVRLGGFVQCDDGYGDQPKVINGASELVGELFGEAGRHARAAVGVNSLPLGASVELEMIVQIKA
jgi:enamine deaminase RidA (YjgF/YER057c/UK114 family)